MKKILTLLVVFTTQHILLSQGFLNNGAYVVLTNSSHIVITGSTGHYTSDNNGLIHNASAGGEIVMEGNWRNNSANQAFNNDGTRVRLRGGNQTIGGSNSTSFYHLDLEGTGVKTLQINTTAGGISNLTGILSVGDRLLDLNSNTLTVSNGSAGAITSSNGYIISETNVAVNPSIIRWNMQGTTGAHIFPFGVGGTRIPFTFNKTTVSLADVSVSTRATTGSNNQPWAGISNVGPVTTMASAALALADASVDAVIDRWWDIRTTAPVTGNVTFSYRLSENTTAYSPTDFGAQHWNGASWESPLGSGSVVAGVGVVQANGLNSFSPYVLAPLVFPLPLTLLDFSASCLNGLSELKWTSVSEQNLSGYIIEKSRDGYVWAVVGEVEAMGNTGQYTYSFIDTEQSDLTYYRLKNRDFDGTISTLGTLSNDCRETGSSINVYPNPSSGNFVVEINSDKIMGEAILLVSDMNGKTIQQREIYLDKGVSTIHFENEVASGVYFVYVLGTKKEFEVLKLVINK